MTDDEKKEYAYLILEDLYKEFNASVNNLNIIREFMKDLLNLKKDKDLTYDFPSILKKKKNKK